MSEGRICICNYCDACAAPTADVEDAERLGAERERARITDWLEAMVAVDPDASTDNIHIHGPQYVLSRLGELP